jgi:RimJ/RimL family protein N-acetyltransferase
MCWLGYPPRMGPDIRLVPFGELHLEAYARILDDPEIQRFTTVPPPPHDDYPRTWLRRYEQGRADGTREAFAILDGADGSYLGTAVAFGIDRETSTAELGYVVAPKARGRGVATEALRRLTRWAFEALGTYRIELVINVDNEASKRVAQKCGYTFEGTLRGLYAKADQRADGEMWSRLATDPEPSNQTDR